MSNSGEMLWIVELAGGRARVLESDNIAVGMDPVIEIGPGESYADIPYEIWAKHQGEFVEMPALRGEHVAPEAAPPGAPDKQTIAALRNKTSFLFAILASISGLYCIYLSLIFNMLPGFAIITLLISGPLTFVWAGAARSIWRGETPSGNQQAVGWTHIVGAALLGTVWASASRTAAGALVFLIPGAVLFEAGRCYLRLALAVAMKDDGASSRPK